MSNLSVKLVVAEVQGGVDRLERFKVNVNFLLLAFLSHNGATVHNQTIGGYCKDKEKILQGCSNTSIFKDCVLKKRIQQCLFLIIGKDSLGC